MLLNERQRLILIGVLQDQRYLAGLPWGDPHSMPRDALGRHRLRVREAREGLVPMNLDGWIGRAPTNSDCVLHHREYARLEGMGLLERHNPHGGRRTSHLRLTAEGIRIAEKLLAEEYGLDDLDEIIDLSKFELLPVEIPADVPSPHELEPAQ